MAFDNRHESKLPGLGQGPGRGQAVIRGRGMFDWKDALPGLVSRLRERQRVKDGQRRERIVARAGDKRFRLKRRIVVLASLGVSLYGVVFVWANLDAWMEPYGGLENVVSGNGDALVERRIAAVEAPGRSAPRMPARQPQALQRMQLQASPPQPLPAGGDKPSLSGLPHYAGAQTLMLREQDGVALFTTPDDVTLVAQVTMQLLKDNGWGESEDLRSVNSADDFYRVFTRGGFQLGARVTIARGMGNVTMIQYNIMEK